MLARVFFSFRSSLSDSLRSALQHEDPVICVITKQLRTSARPIFVFLQLLTGWRVFFQRDFISIGCEHDHVYSCLSLVVCFFVELFFCSGFHLRGGSAFHFRDMFIEMRYIFTLD